MQASPGAPPWAQFLPLIAVLILVIVRMVRPQRISVTRMWLSPIILGAIAAVSIYGTEQLNPAPRSRSSSASRPARCWAFHSGCCAAGTPTCV